ncbi:FolA [Pseudomonas phage PA1C]|nr:FolA [Pseudomonas phage PA1C]
MPTLAMIFAVSTNGIIGINGSIPWHIPEDFKWFKEKTLGHAVVMGRKTWESLGNKPLPGRTNYVLSSDSDNLKGEGYIHVKSLDEVLELSQNEKKVFIIGGERLFKDGITRCSEFYRTIVDMDIDCSSDDVTDVAKFEEYIDPIKWRFISCQKGVTNAPRNPGLGYSLQYWARR